VEVVVVVVVVSNAVKIDHVTFAALLPPSCQKWRFVTPKTLPHTSVFSYIYIAPLLCF
jgi:hypothetical protein